jgi:hypothetical protein
MLTQKDWLNIIENKGATLDVVVYNNEVISITNKEYKNGYAASIKGHELKYQRSINNDILLGYIKSNMRELDEQPQSRIGIWIDNGVWYLDISHVYTSIYNALDDAKQQEQKAIYDFARKVSLDVNTLEVIK